MNKLFSFFFLPVTELAVYIINLTKTYPNFIKYGISVQVLCLQKHPEGNRNLLNPVVKCHYNTYSRNIMRFFSNKNWHQSSRGRPTEVHEKKTFSWWHRGAYKLGLIMYFWECSDINILLTCHFVINTEANSAITFNQK